MVLPLLLQTTKPLFTREVFCTIFQNVPAFSFLAREEQANEAWPQTPPPTIQFVSMFPVHSFHSSMQFHEQYSWPEQTILVSKMIVTKVIGSTTKYFQQHRPDSIYIRKQTREFRNLSTKLANDLKTLNTLLPGEYSHPLPSQPATYWVYQS